MGLRLLKAPLQAVLAHQSPFSPTNSLYVYFSHIKRLVTIVLKFKSNTETFKALCDGRNNTISEKDVLVEYK